MTKTILNLTAAGLVMAALAVLPLSASAQTNTNTAPAKSAAPAKKATTAKKPQTFGPFRGKLTAVDKIAKTFTVGSRTFQVTSETMITKGGKPATLADGVVGEMVSGSFRTMPDGKLTVRTVRFGPKPLTPNTEKKEAATNAPPKQPVAR